MWLSALFFGFLGSFHCIGMCGPIAFMLPLDRQNKLKSILQLSLYHLGRLFTYSLLGFLFGFLGKGFQLFGFQQYLSIIIGVIMILLMILPKKGIQKISITKPIYSLLTKVKSALGKEFKKKRLDTFFTIGFLNGFLPCGLVYMAIFASIATAVPIQGSIYMMLFGLGTIPLMTTVAYLGNFTKTINRLKIRKVIPYVVVLMGILFILRGLGLGIPYISPAVYTVNGGVFCDI